MKTNSYYFFGIEVRNFGFGDRKIEYLVFIKTPGFFFKIVKIFERAPKLMEGTADTVRQVKN